jgi:hypothetical protein
MNLKKTINVILKDVLEQMLSIGKLLLINFINKKKDLENESIVIFFIIYQQLKSHYICYHAYNLPNSLSELI